MNSDTRMARPMAAVDDGDKGQGQGQGQLGRGGYYPKSPKDGRRGSLRKRITTSGLRLGAARRQACAAAKTNGFLCNTIQARQLGSQAGSGSSSSPPPPFTSLHFAATSGWLTILTVRPRPALMCCSVRLSVMPHSAKSSARGEEISTTASWNSGVNSSQF